MAEYEQLELPLEWPVAEQYKIEIRKGQFAQEETLRTHSASSVLDAENLIDGLRDAYNSRANVTWQHEEVDAKGMLYGLDPEGTVYVISCQPPLETALD